jgi:hypothetical protein
LLALAPGQVRHLLQPFPEARPAHRCHSCQLDSRQTAERLDSSVNSTANGDSAFFVPIMRAALPPEDQIATIRKK